jgi:hypothetical protein
MIKTKVPSIVWDEFTSQMESADGMGAEKHLYLFLNSVKTRNETIKLPNKLVQQFIEAIRDEANYLLEVTVSDMKRDGESCTELRSDIRKMRAFADSLQKKLDAKAGA